MIDTESGSAQKYVDEEWDGVKLQFQVCELKSFSPTEYTAAIEWNPAGRDDVVSAAVPEFTATVPSGVIP